MALKADAAVELLGEVVKTKVDADPGRILNALEVALAIPEEIACRV